MRNIYSRFFALVLCMCFVCVAFAPIVSAVSEQQIVTTIGGGTVDSVYWGYLATYQDGKTDELEVISSSLPNDFEIVPYGINGYTSWTVRGRAETSGEYNFKVRFYGDDNPEGIIRHFSFMIYDDFLPDAIVGHSYRAVIAHSLSDAVSYEVTGGSLPEGLRLFKNGSNLVFKANGLADKGTFSFEITLSDGNVTTAEWYRLIVNDTSDLAQDVFALYESFEADTTGWEMSEGWEVTEDDTAFDGNRVIKSTAKSELISPWFHAGIVGSEMTWYDFSEAGTEYSVYLRVPRDPDSQPDEWFEKHIGDYTATGEWTAHKVVYSGNYKAQLVFRYSDTQELMLDMITVKIGIDDLHGYDDAYVGFEYTELIAESGFDFNTHVIAGELPPGMSIVREQYTAYYPSGASYTCYKDALCGSPTQPGFYAFDISGPGGIVKTCITVYDTPETTPGDINGDRSVNTADAALILRVTVDLAKISDLQKTLADYNDDGKVDTADAAAVLRYCVGLGG